MHLINNKYLKEYSPIPLNFNLDEVNNFIGIAEDQAQSWLVIL